MPKLSARECDPLSPRTTGGDAEGRGGSGTVFVRFQPHLLRHKRDPPLSLRDISPRWGESKSRL